VPERATRVLDQRFDDAAAALWPRRCDLRHVANAGDADIDDLDRACLEYMPVLGSVQLGEAREDLRERSLVQFPVGKGDAQLVTLSDIPQIARALEYGIVGGDSIGDELARELTLHRRKIGIEPVEIDCVSGLEFGANRVVFEVGSHQPDRRGDAGIGRHNDLGDPERAGDFGSVQRPGTAERDEGKAARVETLLHGARADRIRHVGIDDRQDALGRFLDTEAKLLA